MKKFISSALTAATLFTGICMTALPASAETDYKGIKLPFEVTAPANISLTGLEGADSETTMDAAWSMSDSMCKWMSDASDSETRDATMEKLQKDYGLNDIYINTQIDWAIDDPVNGWHYTKYWDGEEWTDEDGNKQWAGFGHDKDYQTRTGEWDVVDCGNNPQTVNDCWIFRGIPIDNNPDMTDEEKAQVNAWFYGNDLIPGLKNQLKDDQYTLIETDPESHQQHVSIDWTQHTAYVRIRWAVTAVDKNDKLTPIFSDWSETAGYGKDAAAFVPFTKDTLAPPVISNLRYYEEDFNGYPQVAVTLTVPDELSKDLTEVTSRSGNITVEWEARVPDGKWCSQQGGGTITAGENVVSLIFLAEEIMRQNSEAGVSNPDVILAKDSPIELRARYYCNQYASYGGEWLGEFYTDYSDALTFGAPEMSKPEETSPTESSVTETSKDQQSVEASKNESKPASDTELSKPEEKKGGFPIWIIILIIVIVLIIIIIIIILVLKKKKDDDKNSSTPSGTNTQ